MFDSGVGGLSVLREVRRVMPDADLAYVADRGRAPYGTKTLGEVEAISLDVAGWLIDHGADCLVVACNTASAAALESMRARHPGLPIVGMEPAVKPAALASRSKKVAVFATAATFQGRLFESVVTRFATGVEVITRACPEWVELVESGVTDGAVAETAVDTVMGPVVEQGADVIVLACTHFSFLKPTIEKVSGLEVVDPAPAVADQTARVAPTKDGAGRVVLAASGDPARFGTLAGALAGFSQSVIPFPS
ncbi:MAG TPA: glutamate racemase [Acidimicrobiia bacterium]|nr:glutamate racemase [Acidimicrobiia bacterium]